ncbi:MAG: winged helix-turn-helix transcriptional regulator [Variibacter sp.]|nr:winged helix-turn-helix transcriptional regulator [Variibacter sp.]
MSTRLPARPPARSSARQREPDLAECAACLCFAARRAARTITRAYDHELRRHGLRATQFTLLAALELNGPQTIGDLADFLAVDRTTLTRNLAVAEEQGFVFTRPGEDARARIVAIAPKGQAALKQAFPTWKKVQTALVEGIGTHVAEALHKLARAAPG